MSELSEEEKKAIKVVNNRTERLIEELKIEKEDLIDEPKIAYLITQIEANKTLVNLIETQQKEIEELEKYKRKHSLIKYHYISKDKIREKIKYIEDNYSEHSEVRIGKCIEFLNELLEE